MQIHEQRETLITMSQLTVGKVIVYRLRPSQGVSNARERWRGKIIETFRRRDTMLDVVLVEILDQDYEGEIEAVLVEQIVQVDLMNIPNQNGSCHSERSEESPPGKRDSSLRSE
jgi:hypothetical protein